MKLDSVFIVKVQLPIITNDPNAGALVYDKTLKKFNEIVPIDENILLAMSGRPKAFFRSGFKGKTFYLGTESEVKDPGW